MRSIWIDQSTRRTGAAKWLCGDCGEPWPRGLVGPPFEHDRCWECGGPIVAAKRDASV